MADQGTATLPARSWKERVGRLVSPKLELVETSGRVSCPVTGDADADACLRCHRLRSIRLGAGWRTIVCSFEGGLIDSGA